MNAATVNGTVHPHALPTRYWFEFGPTTDYGSQTAVHDVPPRLAAHYMETWDRGHGGWSGGMTGTDLVHHSEGGASGGFMRFSEPSGLDPNHIDGIGWLHLASYFYPGWHPVDIGANAYLAAGIPDFRDARISLSVRGNNWRPNGSELVWWSQTQSNDETSSDPRRPNWAYTGFSLNDSLQSGEWEQVEYRLLNDSRLWTYAGNNVAQGRALYEYGSIDAAQKRLDIDFFHLLAFVNPDAPPAGTIDFDDFAVTYRNYSLLLPSNGGRLRTSPPGVSDPAALTDGWRNGPDRMWVSTANPAAPLEFIYDFVRPVTIHAVQVHQHADWPSRAIEILTSTDAGQTWSPPASAELPESSPHGPNFAFYLQRKLSTPANAIKFRVLSGFRSEHWGLGELEVFGAGAEMQPDDEPFHVNLDVDGLRPGMKCHYRLVAENSQGRTNGADQVYILPGDARPLVSLNPAARITATSAQPCARLCPLGSRTEWYFEYGADESLGHKTAVTYGGLQQTPRSVFATIADLQPATKYFYRLVATNEAGTSISEVGTFTTPGAVAER
jgi:hypothetical protein